MGKKKAVNEVLIYINQYIFTKKHVFYLLFCNNLYKFANDQ